MWKGDNWKKTVLKRKNLKQDKFEKELSGKGQFRKRKYGKRTLLEREQTEIGQIRQRTNWKGSSENEHPKNVNCFKGQIWKTTHLKNTTEKGNPEKENLKADNSEKDISEKLTNQKRTNENNQFPKGSIWQRTILKRRNWTWRFSKKKNLIWLSVLGSE